jgi:hypothetical protein
MSAAAPANCRAGLQQVAAVVVGDPVPRLLLCLDIRKLDVTDADQAPLDTEESEEEESMAALVSPSVTLSDSTRIMASPFVVSPPR